VLGCMLKLVHGESLEYLPLNTEIVGENLPYETCVGSALASGKTQFRDDFSGTHRCAGVSPPATMSG